MPDVTQHAKNTPSAAIRTQPPPSHAAPHDPSLLGSATVTVVPERPIHQPVAVEARGIPVVPSTTSVARPLIPSVVEIEERLAANEKERRVLRTLLRLAKEQEGVEE